MGMMYRRRRPVARLAAGAATAGVAYRAGQRRSRQDQVNQQAEEAYAASLAPPPQYVAPPPAPTTGGVDELGRLAQMHGSGVLSDEEFAAAKARLLGL